MQLKNVRLASGGAVEKGYFDLFVKLIKNKANIYTQNNLGMTTLMHETSNGHFKCAKLLVESGANLYVLNI